MESEIFHIPVLTNEVIRFLVTNKSGIYIDCTLGGGGHSLAILESLHKRGKLIGIDADEQALTFSTERLYKFSDRIKIKYGNFAQLDKILNEEGISRVDGILFDLGVSSHQIDTIDRGFSYRLSAPLDMRMDRKQQLTAEQIINKYDRDRLVDIFKRFGEEKYAKLIASEIIFRREQKKFSTTDQLAKIINKIVPFKYRIKSLSRVFQALRIEVNQELTNLTRGLNQSIALLKEGGRLVVISYHSLEDRIVKRFFQNQENPCSCPPDIPQCICNQKPRLKILTRRVVKPAQDEIKINPRSRSACLRVAEKF